MSIIDNALDAMKQILLAGENVNHDNFNTIINFGGIDKLEQLKGHPNKDISDKAFYMIETFFKYMIFTMKRVL